MNAYEITNIIVDKNGNVYVSAACAEVTFTCEMLAGEVDQKNIKLIFYLTIS